MSNFTVPPACPPEEYHPQCHVNMIRKSQASFGWKWSPALVTQGIWKNIYIVQTSHCWIMDIVAEPLKDSNISTWKLNITTYVQCVGKDANKIQVLWNLMDDENSIDNTASVFSLTHGEHALSALMRNLTVDTWWPRGHGEQRLYTLNVTLLAEDVLPASKSVKIGFRTVALVQKPVDKGLSFYFEINGRPIFLKGSTWMPVNNPKDDEQLQQLRMRSFMKSAIDVNMNVLRVPGGAIYESDYFYDLADEYGLMVWQDFMFSSALYPADKQFLDLVKKEANFQLRRLIHHPCIIVWNGNQEVELAIFEKRYAMDGPYYNTYKENYMMLFKDILRAEVQNLTTVPYLMSSPSNGILSSESWNTSPNSPEYGDTHSHQFLKDCLDMRTHTPGRFVSEYGWTSWPSYHSLLNMSSPSDLVYGSEFFQHRLHDHLASNGTHQMILRYFNWTANMNTEKGFGHYLYMTQLVQALCLKAETEYYRRMRTNGTMGAIFWQLNDVWPAPSGSTLEYDGRWKMAHYHAAHVFSDILLVVEKEGDNLVGYFVNDGLVDLHGYEANFQIFQWSSVNPTFMSGIVLDNDIYRAQSVTKAFTQEMSYIEQFWEGPEWCYLTFDMWNGNGPSPPQTVMYFTPFNEVRGMNPTNIEIGPVKNTGNNTFEIQTWCEHSSPFVWASSGHIPGWFSENGVTYNCGSAGVKFYFHSLDNALSAERLSKSISFTSLADVMKAST